MAQTGTGVHREMSAAVRAARIPDDFDVIAGYLALVMTGSTSPGLTQEARR